MPADAVPGSTIPEDSEAEILLQDGTWAWAQVTGQRKDRHGRWCVGLRWYASPSVGGREGWYLYDAGFIRRPLDRLSHLVLAPGFPVRLAPALGPGAGIPHSHECSAPDPRHDEALPLQGGRGPYALSPPPARTATMAAPGGPAARPGALAGPARSGAAEVGPPAGQR
jgi:hypothetical protein